MARKERPQGVTIVAIVVLASGVVGTLGAVLHIVWEGAHLAQILGLIVGILTLIVSAGLFMGSKIARLLTTIVLVLQVASSIYSVGSIGFADWEVLWPIVTGVLSLASLVLLYTKQANAYFR